MVDYLCPSSISLCEKLASYPDKVDSDKIPLYWGILGLFISSGANAIVGGGYGWGFYWGIQSVGWSLMRWSTISVWTVPILMWIIRFFLPDNENVNWLYVMFSNFTLLGPILLYWLASILIVIGWIDASFDYNTTETYIRFALWILLSFVASWYQLAWIDSIRDLYSGDNWTGSEELDDIQDSIETSVDDGRL